ncbi:hypothetical protein [Antribacter gilvus]|uniref:hypothetical protein n=1 Tax=Antribacter gilvus TaxID=2304675 RepID=UPI000F77746F|nr:hypothetical protein [Antribacter gilvus]
MEQIQRYRTAVWTYARDALLAVIPEDRDSTWGPVLILTRRVQNALAELTLRWLDLAELGTPQDLPLVEAWRRAAATAALGSMLEIEELAAHVTAAEAPVVVGDVAELVWAFARLDARYLAIPGWTAMADHVPAPGANGVPRRPKGLMTTAARCSDWAAQRIQPSAYRVDALGYAPTPPRPFGPLPRTVSSCADALDRARAHLAAEGLPNPHALRGIVADHVTLSARAARATDDPRLTATWAARASTYRALSAALRNVGGNLGRGRLAADETRFALTLLPDAGPTADDDLAWLEMALRRTDAALANVLALGVAQQGYFVTNRKRLHDTGVRAFAVPVFEPITALSHPDLGPLVRELRPPLPERPRQERPLTVDTAQAAAARQAFRATLDDTESGPTANASSPTPPTRR